ncbi:MAG: ATP-binding protein [Kiritimatiellae bacterium]|nr:ATP-binding protein [Kiritimatiellia bacterium]
MNPEFKERVWKAHFTPTEEAADFEARLRTTFGLQTRYESAQLLIGRSLAERKAPDPLPPSTKYFKTSIPGEALFGDESDIWLCALIVDGKLSPTSTLEDFRSLVEAHWARGFRLIKDELDDCDKSHTKLVARLADYLPETSGLGSIPAAKGTGESGEIRLKLGPVSKTFPGGKPFDFILNAQGAPPHIAFMGSTGGGKTLTCVQLAEQIIEQTQIPFIFIDVKPEFTTESNLHPDLQKFARRARRIEVGKEALPLDFLPPADAPTHKIKTSAMRLRDSLVMCCRSPGDRQRDVLRDAIEEVITSRGERGLQNILETYQQRLRSEGKEDDSIVSRLNELTSLQSFSPDLQPAEFFQQSWIVTLNLPEELKRLATLLLLDATSSFLLDQPEVPSTGNYRSLRHLLIVDEARKVLRDRRSESLVDLIRRGRSKGVTVNLLSQDPSDFEGEVDDFTRQLGVIVSFACAQSQKGLRNMIGVFGRKVLPEEFSSAHLPKGVAFVKAPGRNPERVQCWGENVK